MTPRKRKPENRGLPTRWCIRHGAYYYQVPPGMEDHWDGKKLFRLGKTLAQAHIAYAGRIQTQSGTLRTIGQLLDRYVAEVVPTKAAKTQIDNQAAIRRLRSVFGHMPVGEFEPVHAYGYRDRRGKQAPTACNRELEVLSHAFTKAVEWGIRKDHPMIEGKFRKLKTTPRSRYIEDWEVAEILRMQPRRHRGSVRMIQAYLRVKLLTGRRKKELLTLRMNDVQADGLHFRLAKDKVNRNVVIEWSEELKAAVDDAVLARPILSPYLFCTRDGECYYHDNGKTPAWNSMWQRFMDRVLKETKIAERFTEHDLRAKAGSDAESLERARQLLAHTTAGTTQRVYRRKPETIKPLR
jgi:integrase